MQGHSRLRRRADLKGDLRANIPPLQACTAGIRLMKAGIAVHVPHLTCFMGQVYDGPGAVPEVLPSGTVIEDWYNMSLVELRRCDALLRLPGESTGSDIEVAAARKARTSLFSNLLEQVLAWAASANC